MAIITSDQIKQGCYAAGIINGNRVSGRIFVSSEGKTKYYFFQHGSRGSSPTKSFEPKEVHSLLDELFRKYPLQWVFDEEIEKGNFNSGVILLAIGETEEELKQKMVLSPQYFAKKGSDIIGVIKNEEIRICTLRDHPDCCGATIAYNFSGSDHEDYSPYKDIENLQMLKSVFLSDRRAIIVHLASYQLMAKTLLENLGFKALHTYLNIKSGNEVTLYQLDSVNPDKEKKKEAVDEGRETPDPTSVVTGTIPVPTHHTFAVQDIPRMPEEATPDEFTL